MNTKMNTRPLALGSRLKSNPAINTLGFKPCFQDYSAHERELIFKADIIYYPTFFYADLLNTLGKKTFPSYHSYKFAMDKIKQTAIFHMLDLPHPKTRIFYGNRQKQNILNHFNFPFIAKKARGSTKGEGVYLIHNEKEFAAYLLNNSPAYIQEYLPGDRDIRIVIIGKKVRLAYWRLSKQNDFRTNVSQGGTISFEPVPDNALELALKTAHQCGWNDVGIDIILHKGRPMVLEGNMKYGTQGFKQAGIDYKKMLGELVLKGELVEG
jgi:ribosomal protein S6--L-glutamate ligase